VEFCGYKARENKEREERKTEKDWGGKDEPE
jgi:hypothetical protein